MRRLLTAAATVAVLVSTAVPALAHGGQYRGPGGRSPTDPTAPVKPIKSATRWEAWWSANAWKYINLRERLRERDRKGVASGGAIGETTGNSNPVEAEILDRRAFYRAEILPVLLTALADEDSEVRSAATIALGKVGYSESLLPLRKATGDTVRDVRDGAILGLGMLREPLLVEELRDRLFDPKESERTRSFAALAIGFSADTEATEALIAFLDPAADALYMGGLRRTPYTEASAIVALGFNGDKAAIEPLRRDYASATRYDPAVRSFIAVSLARLGDRDAIPYLLQALSHKREPMRQSAAIALGLLGEPDDAAVLQALARLALTDNDLNTRQFATMGLAEIGGATAVGHLRTLLEKAERIDLPFAALALAVVGDRESLPALRALFAREREPDLKGAIALSLGLFEDVASAESLRAMAFAGVDDSLRGHCLTALGLMRDRASAPRIRALIEEERNPRMRIAAAVSLGLMQDPSAVPMLKQLAREASNVVTRSNACRLLGAVGDPECARILAAFVKDRKENSVVRMNATAGLGMLGDRSDIPLLTQVGIDSNYAVFVDPLKEVSMIM